MSKETLIDEVCKLISKKYPTLKIESSDYHKSSIEEMINYFEKLSKTDSDPIWWLCFSSHKAVDNWRDIRSQIKRDILENKYEYLWKDDKGKPEFEKGVWTVIRLIDHRIHCVLDL